MKSKKEKKTGKKNKSIPKERSRKTLLSKTSVVPATPAVSAGPTIPTTPEVPTTPKITRPSAVSATSEKEDKKEEPSTNSSSKGIDKIDAKVYAKKIEPFRFQLSKLLFKKLPSIDLDQPFSFSIYEEDLFRKLVHLAQVVNEDTSDKPKRILIIPDDLPSLDDKQITKVSPKETSLTTAESKSRKICFYRPGLQKGKEGEMGQNHPYAYFEGSKKDVTYEEMGRYLAEYNDEIIKLLAGMVLKVMRGNLNKKEQSELWEQIHSLGNKKDKFLGGAEITLKQFFALLISASACEVARGEVAYLSMYTAFHRLKNYKGLDLGEYTKKVLNSLAQSPTDNINEVIPVSFKGSQRVMRELSTSKALSEGDYSKIATEDLRPPSKHTYLRLFKRDLDYIANYESKKAKNSTEPESFSDKFNRKITRHLEHTLTGAPTAVSFFGKNIKGVSEDQKKVFEIIRALKSKLREKFSNHYNDQSEVNQVFIRWYDSKIRNYKNLKEWCEKHDEKNGKGFALIQNLDDLKEELKSLKKILMDGKKDKCFRDLKKKGKALFFDEAIGAVEDHLKILEAEKASTATTTTTTTTTTLSTSTTSDTATTTSTSTLSPHPATRI